jgi:Cu/Ag efflux protein CusF
MVLTTKDDKLNLIDLDGTPYIIISNKMLRYERVANSQTEVKGFDNPGEKLILKAQTIKNPNLDAKTRFYTMTSKEIRVFEVVD